MELTICNEFRKELDIGVQRFLNSCYSVDEILNGLDIAIQKIEQSSLDDDIKTFILLILKEHKLNIIEGKIDGIDNIKSTHTDQKV